MNILYLAHRIPYPPNKGDKLRSFRQLEHLARRHRVWCACFVDTPADGQYVSTLRAYCHDVAAVTLNRRRAACRAVLGFVGGATITESYYKSPEMRALLRRWADSTRFDVVFAFSSSMAQYALQVASPRRVLDLCDVDSRKWHDYAAMSSWPTNMVYRTEAKRLAIKERAWIDRFDAALLVTRAEANLMPDGVAGGKLHVVGNGVVLPAPAPAGCHGPNTQRPLTVGFVGVMNYRPNVDAVRWFVDRCWPSIHRACPEAVFRIVGRSPVRSVRRLGAAPGVRVVGEVADAAAEVNRFDVAVAPMRIARGLQNKVLEAMAAAKPVVLTTAAAEGISACNGRDYIVEDTAQDIAAGVVALLSDASSRVRIGAAAQRFVAIHHCWEAELQKLELIVAGAIEPQTRRIDTLPQASQSAPATGGFAVLP